MIVDDLRVVSPHRTLRADVCIVGAGPAGMTIAQELAGTDVTVILLESGLRSPSPWIDNLNRIESVGAERVMDQTKVRNRRLGGTSSTWSGRAATLDEIDFTQREWVPQSGWPITRSSLAGYFFRSMHYLGLAVHDNVVDPPATTSALPANSALRPYVWSYSSDQTNPRDFMRFGKTEFATGMRPDSVRGYLGATVTHINTSEKGHRVTGLEVRALDGLVRHVEARVAILCTGGIENARLLLASNRMIPAGVGNHHDNVGRYLADHPRGPVGFFDVAEARVVQETFASRRVRTGDRRLNLTAGYALSPEVQRDERLLNCSMWVGNVGHPDDPFSAVSDLLHRRGSPVKAAKKVVRGLPLVTRGARDVVIRRRSPVRRVEELSLQIMVEQAPERESRVTLADSRDEFGVPLARIDWRIGEAEARTVRRAAQLFTTLMREIGLPEPLLDPMISDVTRDFLLPDVAHPSGTTRMSRYPSEGVVDENCQVHGVGGLYVSGSSVFPTNGHANPTQTIVALAIRLADRVKVTREWEMA
jgi:choline dehydrogenase-like flavoprotein